MTLARNRTVKNAMAAERESPVERARNIPEKTRLLLVVRAGGRCEFDGCNKYVLEHPITHQAGFFAQAAHIVAFKEDGPRGSDDERPHDPHVLENLMLLCPQCHTLIDRNPGQFSRTRLVRQKAEHEERIRAQTEIGPDRQTAVFILKAPIGGQHVAIGDADITAAIAPRFTNFRGKIEVDLTPLWGQRESPEFLRLAQAQIDRGVRQLYQAGGDAAKVNHISVFGLASIPLLIHLGSQLTNKVPMDFFQRHRDLENWAWHSDGEPVNYHVERHRHGAGDQRVALLLSLSGSIGLNDLPEEMRQTGSIYEVMLENRKPNPTFLRQRKDLEGFRVAFQEAMSMIIADHGLIKSIDLFPAVPAPIAILCGRERLPKAHPSFRVFDRTPQGYIYQLEIG